MDDYRSEQQNEMEALLSIYTDDVEVISEEPNASFVIQVKSNCEVPDSTNAMVSCGFEYTPRYPDDLPNVSITGSEVILAEHEEQLLQLMLSEADNNRGMPMVFTIISAVQDRLHDIVEDILNERIKEAERKGIEEEEINKRKTIGTPCTIESFLLWKDKFDAEVAKNRQREEKEKKAERLKPTGRELFMSDRSMDTSDVQFLEANDDAIAVDESLFEDIDDLELNEDSD